MAGRVLQHGGDRALEESSKCSLWSWSEDQRTAHSTKARVLNPSANSLDGGRATSEHGASARAQRALARPASQTRVATDSSWQGGGDWIN